MNNDEDKANCMTTAMDRGPVYFALWCRYHGIDPTPLMRRHCVNTARAARPYNTPIRREFKLAWERAMRERIT